MPWDASMPLANFQQVHNFYREYFDKPVKVKDEQITFETLTKTPNFKIMKNKHFKLYKLCSINLFALFLVSVIDQNQ